MSIETKVQRNMGPTNRMVARDSPGNSDSCASSKAIADLISAFIVPQLLLEFRAERFGFKHGHRLARFGLPKNSIAQVN